MDFNQLREAAISHYNAERHLLPMYLHLIASALLPIYAGAHASLSRPASAAKPAKTDTKSPQHDEDDDEDDEVEQKMEGMSPRDAMIYPIVAGVVLAGLYFLIKRYGAKAINMFFNWYFAFAGVFSVAKLVGDAATVGVGFVFPTYTGWRGKLYRFAGKERQLVVQGGSQDGEVVGNTATPLGFTPRPEFVDKAIWAVRAALKQRYTLTLRDSSSTTKTNFTLVHAVSSLAGIAISAYANLAATKPWYLTNLQGFAVCYTAFQLLSPTSFTTGSLLLMGLFCYDIWAVFFTPLMVTVAKNLDAPIKLVFPRPDEVVDPQQIPFIPHKISEVTGQTQYSMLGLGDIVLPGIMIALALRFDLYLFYLRKQRMVMRKNTRTDSTSSATSEETTIDKAHFVPVVGHWGDRFWTLLLPASARPARLNASFPKPYFWASMIGYVFGMLATLIVMGVFQHAQPALLYLVPGVLAALWGTAMVRGEVGEMWAFSDAVDEEVVEEGGKGKEGKDGTKNGKEGKEGTKNGWDLDAMVRELWEQVLQVVGLREQKVEDKKELAEVGKSAADGGDAKAKDESGGLLFSFAISRYKRAVEPAESAAADESVVAEKKVADEVSGSEAASETSSDDAVLVGKDDA